MSKHWAFDEDTRIMTESDRCTGPLFCGECNPFHRTQKPPPTVADVLRATILSEPEFGAWEDVAGPEGYVGGKATSPDGRRSIHVIISPLELVQNDGKKMFLDLIATKVRNARRTMANIRELTERVQ